MLAAFSLAGLAVLELRQRDHIVREADAVEQDAERRERLKRLVHEH